MNEQKIPDLNGGWLSKGGLVYIITQVDDKFIWRVVHKKGVIETGICWFIKPENGDDEIKWRVVNDNEVLENGKGMIITVKAQWNFHGGNIELEVRGCGGEVIIEGKKVNKIKWDDRDDFQRVPSINDIKNL